MAKESFIEEMERLKFVGLANHSSDNNPQAQDLAYEVIRLQHVVEELRTHRTGSPMQLQWSNSLTRDQQGTSTFNYTNSQPFANFNLTAETSVTDTSKMDKSPVRSGNQENQMFVLSCAPINGFEKMIHDQVNSSIDGSLDAGPSLLEQANRFAEINALFHLPAHMTEGDPLFTDLVRQESLSFEEKHRRSAAQKAQQQKLQMTIEQHKDRLYKSRHPPRRFPMEASAPPTGQAPSQYRASPRKKLHMEHEHFSMSPPGTDSPDEKHGHAHFEIGSAHSNDHSLADELNTSGNDGFEDDMSPGSEFLGVRPPLTAKVSTSPGTRNTHRQKTPKSSMTVDAFAKQTDLIENELRTLVRDAVDHEMTANAKAQHYTRRFQAKMNQRHTEPLVEKVEKSVAERIASLQLELETLRKKKLKKYAKLHGLGNHENEDDDDDDEDLDVKAEITKAVEAALKKMLVSGGLMMASGGSGSPSTRASVHNPDGSIRNEGESFINGGRIEGGGSRGTGIPKKNESVGFDDHTAAPAPAIVKPAPVIIDDDPPPKPKSKASKLLGISNDPLSGLPVNDPPKPQSAQQNSMFSGIGSLFSKPSSVQSNGGGASARVGVGSNNNNSNNTNRGGSNMSKLQPIIDEGDEMASPRNPSSLRRAAQRSRERQPPPSIETQQATSGSLSNKSEGGQGAGRGANPRKMSFGEQQSSRAVGMSTKNGHSQSSNSLHGELMNNPAAVAELAQEDAYYRRLMADLLSLADVKLNIKRELKDWEKQFTMRNGREPSIDDKAAINDRYIAYKIVVAQVQEAKDLVKASEDKMKEIRERAQNQ